jgi:crossover junction endodeoxyribonuclease RuvC
MRILGIDPGTATVGYGIIEINNDKIIVINYGFIQTSSKSPMSERLNVIYSDMQSLIDTFKPDLMSIEELFFFKMQKLLFRLVKLEVLFYLLLYKLI